MSTSVESTDVPFYATGRLPFSVVISAEVTLNSPDAIEDLAVSAELPEEQTAALVTEAECLEEAGEAADVLAMTMAVWADTPEQAEHAAHVAARHILDREESEWHELRTMAVIAGHPTVLETPNPRRTVAEELSNPEQAADLAEEPWLFDPLPDAP